MKTYIQEAFNKLSSDGDKNLMVCVLVPISKDFSCNKHFEVAGWMTW
jgi:hypothetical protein